MSIYSVTIELKTLRYDILKSLYIGKIYLYVTSLICIDFYITLEKIEKKSN